MSSKPDGFWKRLSQAVGLQPESTPIEEALPTVGEDGLLAESPESFATEHYDEAAAEKPGGPLSRWQKREHVLTQLQEGYGRITQVMEQVQNHIAAQGGRSDRTCELLEQLGRSMSDLPSLSQQQIEALQSIASQLDTTNNRTQHLSQIVDELPKSVRSQTETLGNINRQLEISGEQDSMARQAIEKLSLAISTLDASNTAQIEALKRMGAKADEQADQFNKLIAKQSRRFTMLFAVTLILAAAAIIAVAVSLMLRGA